MVKLFKWIFSLGYETALNDIRKHNGIMVEGDWFTVNPQLAPLKKAKG